MWNFQEVILRIQIDIIAFNFSNPVFHDYNPHYTPGCQKLNYSPIFIIFLSDLLPKPSLSSFYVTTQPRHPLSALSLLDSFFFPSSSPRLFVQTHYICLYSSYEGISLQPQPCLPLCIICSLLDRDDLLALDPPAWHVRSNGGGVSGEKSDFRVILMSCGGMVDAWLKWEAFRVKFFKNHLGEGMERYNVRSQIALCQEFSSHMTL